VDLEDYYSRNLEKIGLNLLKIYNKGTIKNAITGMN
jgi:hypothetical protein